MQEFISQNGVWLNVAVVLILVGIGILHVRWRKTRTAKDQLSYMLLVVCNDHISEVSATQFVRNKVETQSITRKEVSDSGIELNMKIRLKDNDTNFVNTLLGIRGVTKVLLFKNGKEGEETA